jgi:NTE family protein
MSQIIDRRNELTGNLSLNQELAFIDKVNDLVRENRAVKPDHAYIAIRTVELDLDLDYASKLDRGSWHIRTLIERGKAKGPDLLKPESVWSWKTRASQEAKALAAIGVRTSSRS